MIEIFAILHRDVLINVGPGIVVNRLRIIIGKDHGK